MIDITDKKNIEEVFAQDFGSPYFPVLADLYLQDGDLRRAKLVCEMGLKHSSNDCGKFVLAKVALAEEKLTVAEKWLKQVVNDNPSNFNAMRILIRLEFVLMRSSKTIKKYIQHILQYLPKDVECLGWLENISSEFQIEKKTPVPQNIDDHVSNGVPILIENIDYDIEESMVTFTMLQVLKSQKHYQQALVVLKMMESMNLDSDRILKERNEIQSLLTGDTSA